MDVIIVCHTEFGYVRDKHIIFDKKASEGVVKGVAVTAQVAEQFGAKVTFAVCPEVAEHFPKGMSHEVGLHVHAGWETFRWKKHAWNVGDSYLKERCRQSNTSTSLSDHPFQEQLDMIRKGKERLMQVLGMSPRVFVAGRWALNNDTIRVLASEGFTHDCSAIPHSRYNYDWSSLARISLPYHPSEENYQKKGNTPLLIVPVSRALLGISANPESALVGGLSWLKACFLEHYLQQAPLFHIALHSPAMTDPFYMKIMESYLSFIAGHQNIRFRFASEIGEYPDQKISPNILPYLLAGNLTLIRSAFGKFLKIA